MQKLKNYVGLDLDHDPGFEERWEMLEKIKNSIFFWGFLEKSVKKLYFSFSRWTRTEMYRVRPRLHEALLCTILAFHNHLL